MSRVMKFICIILKILLIRWILDHNLDWSHTNQALGDIKPFHYYGYHEYDRAVHANIYPSALFEKIVIHCKTLRISHSNAELPKYENS